MKKLFSKIKKMNNKGLTLVELMVAIAILSVAIVPLMYAFVNSARYNARGRELQQTSVLAHTIMENCKGYTYDEIKTSMTDASKSFLSSDMKHSSTTWGNSVAGDYATYYIGNVKLENQFYDAKITLQPHEVQNLYAGTSESSFDMLNTRSMNAYLDAVFTNNTASIGTPSYTAEYMDFEAYNAALEKIAEGIRVEAANNHPSIIEEVRVPYNKIAEALDLVVSRSIIITADNSTGNEIVNVNYQYEFELTSGAFTYVYVKPDGTGTENITWNCGTTPISLYNLTFNIYDNSAIYDAVAHPAQVENIYFFYYPAYNGNTSISDYPINEKPIVVNNNLGRSVNLYIVKQKNPAYSDTQLNNLESSYSPTVNVSGVVKLYDNFRENLGGNNTMTPPTIVGAQVDENDKSLYEEDDDVLMYKVQVSIYHSGVYNGTDIPATATPIITLDGTILDW